MTMSTVEAHIDNLVHCPFCDADARAFKETDEDNAVFYHVGCFNKLCYFRPKILRFSKDEAVAIWNSRPISRKFQWD